jgi:uncharacterized protein YsxB (DUF464 family)
MTQSKLPLGERESIVLQTLKKHGEISQNKLKEELASKMAGNTVVAMLKTLKLHEQADYYKEKNKYIWYPVEKLPENDAEEQEQLHELMRRQLRILQRSYKTMVLATKISACRHIAQICFMMINGRILSDLDKKIWHEGVDEQFIKYLKVLHQIIFSDREHAEMVYTAVASQILGMPLNEALSSLGGQQA